jgi:hypothetical protein
LARKCIPLALRVLLTFTFPLIINGVPIFFEGLRYTRGNVVLASLRILLSILIFTRLCTLISFRKSHMACHCFQYTLKGPIICVYSQSLMIFH